MKNNKGRQEYGIFLNNEQLRRDAMQSKALLRGIGEASVAEGARIDNSYKRITNTMAALGGTVALGALAKGLYDFANAFDKSMREVATISDTVTNNIEGFKQQILELGTKVPIAADAAGKALYQIVSAGYDGAAGMNLLEVSAKSAIAGMTDTTTAADAITTLLNAYKMSATEAANISDQLFMTAKLGKTTFGELGQSISQAAPIAASFGIETEQVLAAVATLTKSGTPTAQAMTQIRAAIIGASKVLGDGAFQTRTFQEGLSEIAAMAGGSESKLRALIPEIEGMNGILGLTGLNAKMAASDLAALGGATGETEKAFAKMSDTADAQMTILKNNMLRKFHEMGVGAVDIVGDMAKFLNNAFETGAMDDVIATVGVLIATLGVYKTQLLVVNAVKLVGNNLMYSAEIAELQKLLPAKEASKNADLEAAVAKGQLSQKRAEELIAIRAAVQARLEELRAIAAIAQVEAQAAAIAHRAALQKALSSKSLVAQRQMELSLAKLSGDASEIELAEKSLLEAQEQRHIAVKARKATADTLSIAQSKASTAATAVDTIQQGINTAATSTATKAKTLMTIATGKLTTAFKAMGAAFKANQFGLILTGITLVVSALSMFKRETNDATKTAKNFATTIDGEVNKSLADETTKLQSLRRQLIETEPASQKRIDLIKELKKQYPDIIGNINAEKTSIDNVIISIDNYIKKLEDKIRLQVLEQKYVQNIKDLEDAKIALASSGSASDYSEVALRVKTENALILEQLKYQKDLVSYSKEYADLVKERDSLKDNVQTVSLLPRTPQTKEAYDAWNEKIKKEQKDKGLPALGIEPYEEYLKRFEKNLQEADKKANRFKTISEKITAIEKEKPDVEINGNYGVDSSSKSKDYTDQLKREQQEKERFYTDMELTVRQAEINAMDEGVDKVLAQNQLNYDKEIEQIKRQKEDKLAKTQEWERTIWESQNQDYKKKGLKFKPQTTELSKDENQQFDTMAVSARTTLATGNKKAYEVELNDYATFAQSYLDKVEQFKQNLKNVEDNIATERAKLVAKGGSAQDLAAFDAQAKTTIDGVKTVQAELLAGLDEQMNMKSETFVGFVEGMVDMNLEKLLEALKTAKSALEAEIANGTGGENTEQLQVKIKTLEAQIVKLTQNKKETKEVTGDPTKKWKDTLQIMNDVKGITNDIVGNFDGLDDTTKVVLDAAMNIATGVINMIMGITMLATGAITTTTMVAKTASAAIAAVEKASVILAIISAAIQVVMAIANVLSSVFNDDLKKEKEIKRIQGEVDALEKSYDKLGKAIDEAYSADAANLIEQSDELLRQQNEQIKKQIELEKSKKKPDTEAIDKYEAALEENNKKLEENKKNVVEAINGTSIKSAIDDFASAYVDAWAAGEDKAASMKEVVRKMIKSAVTELIKSRLSPEVNAFMNFLSNAMRDGVLTIAEQQTLDALESSIYNKLDGLDDSLDQYIEDKQGDREASKRGIATASQESVDENNGRLTAIQSHTYELNEQVKLLSPNIASIKDSINFIRDNAAQQLEALYGIRNNTAPIAEMKSEIGYMRTAIEVIRDKGIPIQK